MLMSKIVEIFPSSSSRHRRGASCLYTERLLGCMTVSVERRKSLKHSLKIQLKGCKNCSVPKINYNPCLFWQQNNTCMLMVACKSLCQTSCPLKICPASPTVFLVVFIEEVGSNMGHQSLLILVPIVYPPVSLCCEENSCCGHSWAS